MRRLSTLLLNNNSIFRIGNIGLNLTNLTTLILTNNKISSLSEIDHLVSLSNLELLSLLENPITNSTHYRLYVIYKSPSLKCLDYQKVTRIEREQSKVLFTSQEGSVVLNEVERERSLLVQNEEGKESKSGTANELSNSQKEYLRSVIESAQTKEEMDRIESQLRVSHSYHHHYFISTLSLSDSLSIDYSLELFLSHLIWTVIPLNCIVRNTEIY